MSMLIPGATRANGSDERDKKDGAVVSLDAQVSHEEEEELEVLLLLSRLLELPFAYFLAPRRHLLFPTLIALVTVPGSARGGDGRGNTTTDRNRMATVAGVPAGSPTTAAAAAVPLSLRPSRIDVLTKHLSGAHLCAFVKALEQGLVVPNTAARQSSLNALALCATAGLAWEDIRDVAELLLAPQEGRR
jgi:hypothetical protein